MTAKKNTPIKPKARGGKPLMSELLKDTRKYLKQAEQADVEPLRQFLFNEPERPLITMGHGGSHSSASYAALLYGTNCGLGKVMTPYQCNSLSDETLRNSKLLLVSKSLMNQDVEYFANRMARVNPKYSCAFTMQEKENANMKRMKKACPNGLVNHAFELPHGFISVNGTFAYFSLLYKAFTGDNNFADKLALSDKLEDNFTYRTIDGTIAPPDLSTISQFTVLYGSYGEPVAHKMESNMTEAGLASCVIADYRDECHGKYMALSNFIKSDKHPQTDCALVVLVTPREENLCKDMLEFMPGHLPIVIIRTDDASPLGSIDLLYKMCMFTAYYGEKALGSNPNDPLNKGGFIKSAFRDEVNFTNDFDLYGPLSLSSKLPAYTDRFSFNTASSGVDILGVHFGSIDAACLMALFDDSRKAAQYQAKIIVPENGYLNNPQLINKEFFITRFGTPPTRKKELKHGSNQWYTEWQKWLHGEPADVDLLNSGYINWLGGVLRFRQEPDGHISVERIERTMPEHLPQTGLIGGICGEVLGSKYELEKDKEKVKEIAGKKNMKVLANMSYTDDTILSLAIAKWLMDDPSHDKESLIELFKHFGNRYRVITFGRNFRKWVESDDRAPYGAPTNGSAMRVAPVAWYAKTLDECLALAKTTAEVTHNSEEGIRGAQAVAAAIFLNRTGKSKADIKSYIEKTFGYDLNRTTDEIRPTYTFETACDKSVPESIICFLEADDYMDAVIRAISLGGDTDTMACIAGNIAAATMPVPEDIAIGSYDKLPQELREILDQWNKTIN
jgi:ADP-ribosylglycohydrolase